MLRNTTRAFAMMALSVPAVLGLAGVAEAQDKFKLGMAVGGNTCCEWMKAQGDVARAIAEQNGWDYVPHVLLGQFFRNSAWRKNIRGVIGMPEMVGFWNMEKVG